MLRKIASAFRAVCQILARIVLPVLDAAGRVISWPFQAVGGLFGGGGYVPEEIAEAEHGAQVERRDDPAILVWRYARDTVKGAENPGHHLMRLAKGGPEMQRLAQIMAKMDGQALGEVYAAKRGGVAKMLVGRHPWPGAEPAPDLKSAPPPGRQVRRGLRPSALLRGLR